MYKLFKNQGSIYISANSNTALQADNGVTQKHKNDTRWV